MKKPRIKIRISTQTGSLRVYYFLMPSDEMVGMYTDVNKRLVCWL